MTVSHHMLRRTARAREKRIEKLQRDAESGYYGLVSDAVRELRERYDLGPHDRVKVEPTARGPWRWRIVTY